MTQPAFPFEHPHSERLRRVLEAQRQMMNDGMTHEEAAMAAFELNSRDRITHYLVRH